MLGRLLLLSALPGCALALRMSELEPLDVSPTLEWDLEDLPDNGEGPEPELVKVDKKQVQLRDTPFKNVLLIVHCRVMDRVLNHWYNKPMNATALCEKRRPLFKNYEEFFPEMIYWRGEVECSPGGHSPHGCLTSLVKTEQAQRRDGIFYLHFDALVRPEVLKHHFNKHAMGAFNDQEHCNFQTGCGWGAWGAVKGHLQSALDSLPSKFQKIPGFWLGVDDLFYIPRNVFGAYAELAPYFAAVHHEVAGPTMWRILAASTPVSLMSLGCTGGCCQQIPGREALRPTLRCGHPFRLMEEETRIPFQKAMLSG